jgi:hypothetical protein
METFSQAFRYYHPDSNLPLTSTEHNEYACKDKYENDLTNKFKADLEA